MPYLQINTDIVEELASRISGQYVVIEDALNNLRAINAELSGAWDGPSQDTFEGTYGNWIAQLESYSETLTNVQGYLRSVAENFRQLDEAAQQAATGATMAE